MKQLLIFFSALISLTSNGQARFVQQIDHTTYFGINMQQFSSIDESTVANELGIKYVRDAVILKDYTTGIDKGVSDKSGLGKRVVVNIDYDHGASSVGLKNFPTGADLTDFKKRLGTWLSFNAKFVWAIVIENEPYNRQYFNWSTATGAKAPYTTVKDYLAELSAAVDSAHKYGTKVADGASHIDYFDAIKAGNVGSDPQRRADSAWSKYPNSYNALELDYVNFHGQLPSGITHGGDSVRVSTFTDLVEYFEQRTGHKAASNEWHQEDDGGALTQAQIKVLNTGMVTACRNAHIAYSIPIAPNELVAGKDLPFTSPPTSTTLNYLGLNYRDAIASGQ